MLNIYKKNDKKTSERINTIKNRGEFQSDEVEGKVREIISNVKKDGDGALLKYTKMFDNVSLSQKQMQVSEREIKDAYKNAKKSIVDSLKIAYENISEFHKSQIEYSKIITKEESIVGQLIRPIERAGLYIPGGTAPLVSTVLMNAIPARIAGVRDIVITSPPDKKGKINQYLLIAADLVGVKKIFKAGGAQAIAAMAYGTESIPKVDKIVGPGNVFVAQAKKYVFGAVDIDMIAGPSEILIIADESANPEFISADLLSQAEHDPLASSVLITTSSRLANAVKKSISNEVEKLKRKDIAKESLLKYGAIFIVSDLDEAINMANEFAPEHLELQIKDPFLSLDKIRNAGAVFVGSYTPEACGDYIAGPNHVLPTGGTSRFFSPLGVYDFIKRTSLIYYSKSKLKQMGSHVTAISEIEGLQAHTLSVKKRSV